VELDMPNPEHVELVRKNAVLHWLSQNPNATLDCSDANFSGAVFSGFDLSRVNFQRANFHGAKLNGTKFVQAQLHGCDLTAVDLEKADCSFAKVYDSVLTDAVVVDTKFHHAEIVRVNIDGANLRMANLENAHLEQISFPKNTDFSGCNLKGVSFVNSRLPEANFRRASLKNARFDNAKLVGSIFDATELTEVNLNGADLTSAHFSGASFKKATIMGATLRGSYLIGADCRYCRFQKVDFEDADWAFTDFSYALFSMCNTGRIRRVYKAKNLHKAVAQHGPSEHQTFESVKRSVLTHADWEMIRIFGRLPLFAASSAALVFIPLYLYAIAIYNQHLDAWKAALKAHANDFSLAVLTLPRFFNPA
jgi:uncharacterized protein YjbI with pentapeptide repeats